MALCSDTWLSQPDRKQCITSLRYSHLFCSLDVVILLDFYLLSMALAPIGRAPYGDIGWDHVDVYPVLAPRFEFSRGGHTVCKYPHMTCKTRFASTVKSIIWTNFQEHFVSYEKGLRIGANCFQFFWTNDGQCLSHWTSPSSRSRLLLDTRRHAGLLRGYPMTLCKHFCYIRSQFQLLYRHCKGSTLYKALLYGVPFLSGRAECLVLKSV